ncbi:MAG: hypothetical protein ACOCYB_01855 [Alkalispirochaeta sp.]
MAVCYKCGYTFPEDLVVTRALECPQCSAPVRCCKNCVFYEPGAHWDCRETIPEPVSDKERSNFCDYFRLAATPRGDGSGGSDRTNDILKTRGQARDDFDALFS